MSKPIITKADVQSYKDLRKRAGHVEERISKRIHYILEKVHETFGSKLEYWYMHGAEEGEGGDLLKGFPSYTGDHSFDNICFVPYHGEWVIILEDGSEFGFGEGEIPIHWLYQDFEKELTEGKQRYEQRQVEQKRRKKERREAKKREKERLKASAVSKLSPEERAALGL
jgi:hypothetical protein